jgi:hypothetical protein
MNPSDRNVGPRQMEQAVAEKITMKNGGKEYD